MISLDILILIFGVTVPFDKGIALSLAAALSAIMIPQKKTNTIFSELL